jgi:hypothetical protein
MYARHLAVAIVLAITCGISTASAAIPKPILEYTLNSSDSSAALPAGATILNTGSVGAPGDLTMFSAGDPGSSVNLYSGDAAGVSGLPGDRAMDNSVSAGMGSAAGYVNPNRGPGATNDTVNGILAGKTQLTISGWIRTTPGQTWANLAQVWAGDAGNFMHIRGLNGQLVFQFSTIGFDNMQLESGPSNAFWNQIDQWMYVGVTWDSTNSGRLEFFYVDGTNTVQSGRLFATTNATLPITTTTNVSGGVTYGLSLGNQAGLRLRPFDGLLDNFRVFDAALTQADLQTIVNKDLLNQSLSHPGDFDSDGDVDGADFVAWQTNFPTATGATLAQGDADADGDVDGADFVVWQTNFPFTPGPGNAPVPEPASWMLGVAALAVFRATMLRATPAGSK